MGLFRKSKKALLDSTALSTPHLSLAQTLQKTWDLSRPYLVEDPDRHKTYLLMAAIGAATAAQVGLMNWGNNIYADLYQSFAHADMNQLWAPLKQVLPWMISSVAASIAQPYFTNLLTLRWGAAMTSRLQTRMVESGANLGLQQMPKSDFTENPHQQIVGNVGEFVDSTVNSALSLVQNTAMLALFSKVLWHVSGSLPVTIGKHHLSIPAYMLCLAVLYSGIGTWAVNKRGNKMPGLYNDRSKYRGAHEFALTRVKENAQSIALMGGEKAESGILTEKYNRYVKTGFALVKKTAAMNGLYSTHGITSNILPAIALSAKVFAKTMDFATFNKGVGAYFHVNQALSWLIHSQNTFNQHRSVTAQLSGFVNAVEEFSTKKKADAGKLREVFTDATRPLAIQIRALSIFKPNKSKLNQELLIHPFNLDLKAGDRIFLTGKSGKGKTTLLHFLGGIHGQVTGHAIICAAKKPMYIPQEPHLPSKTLRGIMCYPEDAAKFTDDEVKNALAAVDLWEELGHELDDEEIHGEHWKDRLSGGQKHRISFARVFLHKPDLLLLDEVTRSLDEETAHEMYDKLVKLLPNSIIISIAHHKQLVDYHTMHAHLINHTLIVTPMAPPIPRVENNRGLQQPVLEVT